MALGFLILALGSWWFPPLVLKFSTPGFAVFDGILIGCGVMVVSTLGFGVFEIFLEFSAHGSTVCDGVLLWCVHGFHLRGWLGLLFQLLPVFC